MTRILHTEIKSGERLVATDITDLTFFPKGTILTFSSEAYSATSAAFKEIWKICDGQNGTPNLVNRFLCGGSSSGAIGGADSQTIAVPLKSHKHAFSDGVTNSTSKTLTGYFPSNGAGWRGVYSGIVTQSNEYGYLGVTGEDSNNARGYIDATHSHGVTGAISTEGEASPTITVNTVPKYYQVIYIMKVA
jgi:hypothetical protein